MYSVEAPNGRVLAETLDYSDALAVIACQGSAYPDAVHTVRRDGEFHRLLSIRQARGLHPVVAILSEGVR